jgi:hypothetical protein
MDFGVYLVRRGLITADDYVDIREQQSESHRRLGELALRHRKLSMRQVLKVLDAQVDSTRPFGKLAVDKGYMTQGELLDLLGLQSELTPSISDVLIERLILDEQVVEREARCHHNEIIEESMVVQDS